MSNPFFAGGGHKPNKKQGGFAVYHAIICRVFRKPKNSSDTPRLEVLLQKHSHAHDYGFVTCISTGEKLSDVQRKYKLASSFYNTCGSNPSLSIGDHTETPPLTAVKDTTGQLSKKSSLFLVDPVHNGWSPNPLREQKHIEYSNETITLGGSQYQVNRGHVWVNIMDLNQQSSAQGKNVIDKNTIQILSTSYGAICKLIPDKLKSICHQRFLSAGTETLIYNDTTFQVKCSVDYATLKATLTLNNISQNPIKVAPPLITHNEAILGVKHNIEQPVDIQGSGNISIVMDIKIGGFFSYNDLPVLDLMYLTKYKNFFKCKLRLPIFLYRFCNTTIEALSGKDADTTKGIIQAQWGNLQQQADFSVPISNANVQEEAKRIIYDIQNQCRVPMFTSFDNYYPVVLSLQDKASVHLLKFDMVNNQPSLTVTAKHSEPKLHESLFGLIDGLSNGSSGVEESLLDVPAF